MKRVIVICHKNVPRRETEKGLLAAVKARFLLSVTVRLLPFKNRMPLWLKIVDAMADNGPIAPKKPADLRYVTLPKWTQPVSLYLLERIEGDKVWLICRPALDSSQESEPQLQLPD